MIFIFNFCDFVCADSGLVLSLADELGQVSNGRLPMSVQQSLRDGRHAVGAFQLRGSSTAAFDSSPESHPVDADSGHSTTNSPDGTARPTSIASSSCCSCSLSEQSLSKFSTFLRFFDYKRMNN